MEPLGGFPGVQAAHHLLEPTGTGKSLLCHYSVIKTEQQGCPESTKKTLSMTERQGREALRSSFCLGVATPVFLPGKLHGQGSLAATVHAAAQSDVTKYAHT